MNSTPPDDDSFDALLGTLPAPIPDGGFTGRVLAALPSATSAAARTSARLRAIFIGTGTLVGLGSILLGQPGWPAFAASTTPITAAFARITDPFTDPLVATALVLAAGSLVVAFHAEIRERLLD
jgi:hypothetical protein